MIGSHRSARAGIARRTGLATCLASLALLCGLAGTASADPSSHAFAGDLTGSGTSTLANPSDVAVDRPTGNLFVTDPANHRVEKFDSNGQFLSMFGKEVDQTTGGDVCTAASGDTCKVGASNSASGGFVTPTYLAIDNYPGGEGDIYVADTGDDLVSKFTSDGHIISGWGSGGQKDGSDSVTVNFEGEIISGLPGFGRPFGLAVGPKGTLYVGGTKYADNVWEYRQGGEYIKWSGTSGTPWLKVNPQGYFFWTNSANCCFFNHAQVLEGIQVNKRGEINEYVITEDRPATGFAIDPVTEELYEGVTTRTNEGPEHEHGPRIDHYAADCNPVGGECEPVDTFGEGHLSEAQGMAVDGSTGTVYVANEGSGSVAVFEDVRPKATTLPATNVTETSVKVNAHIDPRGHGDIVECRFEYGFERSYGKTAPCSPTIPSGSGPIDVGAELTGFSAGTREHYRVVIKNAAGLVSAGVDETFITTAPPAIDGLEAENLTATSAELIAQVNPNGLETTYRFEYGATIEYGQEVSGTIGAASTDQRLEADLADLVPHTVYHFRLVAENADGPTNTEDHTLNFYPPGCPNENVRQQTEANFLPDCRAYELVSPENAGGTQLFPNGPNTGYATDPSRFSYTGLFSTVPNSGGSPIDGSGDLYVATRTDHGWVNRYVGIPSNEAAVDGGPPMGPPGSTPGPIRNASQTAANGGSFTGSQDGVITDLSMDTFLDFNDGNQAVESIFTADFQNHTVIGSNAPYVWAADGSFQGRWPTNLGAVGDGTYNSTHYFSHGGYLSEKDRPLTIAPGGIRALDCPYVAERGEGQSWANDCPGDVTSSADLSHFVFATEWNLFAPGGNLNAPGSVYDNNTRASTVSVASVTPEGVNIPSEPLDNAGDALQIPSVSKDGSHILMAASGTGPCGFITCPVPPCGEDYNATKRCPMQPSHLYMRVDDSVTYDVSQGHDVTYIGATGDGAKVYFTTEEQLLPEDQDSSVDLYMWSEGGELAGHPLILVSKADNAGNPGEAGNTDNCNVDYTTKCGVVPYNKSNPYYCENFIGTGGNCLSDNFIASQSGDIYFYSPEILDGSKGVPNQANLYVFRNGKAQFVTTLSGPPACFEVYTGEKCAHILRMQVSPDGEHMAFITNSEITQYNSAGHLEMYVYTAATGRIVCASCIPDGEPPTHDVAASQDGLFMANDGRAFFTTDDALVHVDTNQAQDVYEYVDGRPQLITPGTGDTRSPKAAGFFFGSPGLDAVGADGRDVYFSTFDSLVSQDHNGLFLKFYDARTGGGFAAPAPPPPCEAADECHGPGSSPPGAIVDESGAALANGNAASKGQRSTKGKHRRAKRHHHRHRNKRESGRGAR